jgi:hypothetical protein
VAVAQVKGAPASIPRGRSETTLGDATQQDDEDCQHNFCKLVEVFHGTRWLALSNHPRSRSVRLDPYHGVWPSVSIQLIWSARSCNPAGPEVVARPCFGNTAADAAGATVWAVSRRC